MKKIFFTVLVALAAVGGALTVKAVGIYEDASGNIVVCDQIVSLISCAIQAPLFEYGHGGEPTFLIPPSVYASMFKQ